MYNKKFVISFVLVIAMLSCLSFPVSAGFWDNLFSGQTQSTEVNVYKQLDNGDSILGVNKYSDYVSQSDNLVLEKQSFFSPEFYAIQYASQYLFHSDISIKNSSQILVGFGVDLNNINIIKSYGINHSVSERKTYYFNNFIRSSTTDLTKIFNKATSSSNYQDNDYFGFPFYITSCYIDCDSSDTIPAVTWNMKSYSPNGDVWNMFINAYSGASSLWMEKTFPSDNIFYDKSNVLRFSKTNYKCNYAETSGVKTIKYGCILTKNPSYRNNLYNSSFSFYEIDPIFEETSVNKNNIYIHGTYEYSLDLNQSSFGFDDKNSTNSTSGEPNSGTGSEQQVSISRQRETQAVMQVNENNLAWQSVILSIMKFIFSILIVIFYILQIVVYIWLLFFSYKLITESVKKNIDKLTKVGKLG